MAVKWRKVRNWRQFDGQFDEVRHLAYIVTTCDAADLYACYRGNTLQLIILQVYESHRRFTLFALSPQDDPIGAAVEFLRERERQAWSDFPEIKLPSPTVKTCCGVYRLKD